jgi:hypothetical protein
MALATGIRYVDSQFDRGYGTGGSAWLTAGGRVFPWLDLTAQGQWREKRAIPGQSYTRTLSAGVRGDISGSHDNLFAEWTPQWDKPKPTGGSDSSGRWSTGVEFKLADDLWVATGFGSHYGLEQGADRIIVIANLRWAVSSKSRLLGQQ